MAESYWHISTGTLLRALGLGLIAALAAACATVRPEQRALLADPIMQFESGVDSSDQAARDHVLENREGSLGKGSIKGGGCGCN